MQSSTATIQSDLATSADVSARSAQSAVPVPGIVSAISRVALQHPDHLAVISNAGRLSYQSLEDRSNQLAAYLRSNAVGRESCVAILMDRGDHFIVAALAILKTGAAYLPIDAATPLDRVGFILRDSQAVAVLTEQGKTQLVPAGGCRVIAVDGPDAVSIQSQSHNIVPAEISADDLAYVIYTSGSTGQPKGCEITHANLQNLIHWHQNAFALTSADHVSFVAGLGFDAAVWELWPCLTSGATLHIPEEPTRKSPQLLHDWIVAEKISVSFCPTVLAEQLLHFNWPKETALRYLLTGADTLHRRPPVDIPFKLVNNYGPTECTVVATSGIVRPANSDNDPVGEAPSIGKPIANTRIIIVNENLREVPTGESGEICIAGALVGRGYRNRPDLTAARFVKVHPLQGEIITAYRTGDRARVLPDGEIAFMGRLDDQIKIRGYRVELGEIVATLDRLSGIDASSVTVHNMPSGPALTAYVVLTQGKQVNVTDIKSQLAATLPEYMVPTYFVALKSLPMSINGKLDRTVLPVPDQHNQLLDPADVAKVAAANQAQNQAVAGDGLSIESRLSAIVSELLGNKSIGPGDNFFMAGGHSMLGVQLTARIRDAFSVKLSLRQLFMSPTVAALSKEIEKLRASNSQPK